MINASRLPRSLFAKALFISLCSMNVLQAVSREALIALIASFDPRPRVGMEIISMPDGQQLYAQGEGQLFVPASTTKLVTAAAALHYLGPEFNFSTKIFYENSNLYIQGSGDPSLTGDDIRQVVKIAIELGIRTVNDLIIDTNEFDDTCYAAGTCTDDIGSIYLVPVGSLMMDRKMLRKNADELYPAHNVMTYEQLGTLLRDAGITVEGTMRKGSVSETAALLVEHTSQSLRVLLAKMLQESDNLYADCLCKKLGTVRQKDAISWDTGTGIMRQFLVDVVGLHPAAFILRDGSGMSRYNALTPRTIVHLLRTMSAHPAAQDFRNALPQSGLSGTLKGRMKSIAGSVQAKTGTMGGITALSGYLVDKHQQEYIFSILVNNCINDATWPQCKQVVEDAICLAVAEA